MSDAHLFSSKSSVNMVNRGFSLHKFITHSLLCSGWIKACGNMKSYFGPNHKADICGVPVLESEDVLLPIITNVTLNDKSEKPLPDVWPSFSYPINWIKNVIYLDLINSVAIENYNRLSLRKIQNRLGIGLHIYLYIKKDILNHLSNAYILNIISLSD